MYIYNCLDTPGSWQPSQIKLIVKQGNNFFACPARHYLVLMLLESGIPPSSLPLPYNNGPTLNELIMDNFLDIDSSFLT